MSSNIMPAFRAESFWNPKRYIYINIIPENWAILFFFAKPLFLAGCTYTSSKNAHVPVMIVFGVVWVERTDKGPHSKKVTKPFLHCLPNTYGATPNVMPCAKGKESEKFTVLRSTHTHTRCQAKRSDAYM